MAYDARRAYRMRFAVLLTLDCGDYHRSSEDCGSENRDDMDEPNNAGKEERDSPHVQPSR